MQRPFRKFILMNHKLILVLAIYLLNKEISAQQNWAAIPCFKLREIETIDKMIVDSLHSQIILSCGYGSTICNTTYKGIFAYDGNGFFALDRGIETHRSEPYSYNNLLNTCISFSNQTLYGGGFLTVGSNTLMSKSLALWNGTLWDTFPKRAFKPDLNYSTGGGFYGFLRHNGKLWFYGGFDTIGNVITKDIATFNGSDYEPVPPIPVNIRSPIYKMIEYKNKLVALGIFYNYPAYSFNKIAQFDGTSWSEMGQGIKGNLLSAGDLAVYKDTLYVAGNFSKADGNMANMVMKWDGTQFLDAGFGSWCSSGPIYRLIELRDRLYALGSFGCAANQKAFGVAYYQNGIWTVPKDSIGGGGIQCAVKFKEDIYIAGNFNRINGDTSIQKFAKLLCPDFDAASGCLSDISDPGKIVNIKIFPNPAKDKLYFEYNQGPSIDNISICNVFGQELANCSHISSQSSIDISTFLPGLYLLKFEYAGKFQVLKIVKE